MDLSTDLLASSLQPPAWAFAVVQEGVCPQSGHPPNHSTLGWCLVDLFSLHSQIESEHQTSATGSIPPVGSR